LYNMFQAYEVCGLLFDLRKHDFKSQITGYLFKHSYYHQTRVIITSEVHGIWIVFNHISPTMFKLIEPIFKQILIEIKDDKYSHIRNVNNSVIQLRKADPKLFSNLIHNEKYSRAIQKRKQPIIITEQEYNSSKIPSYSKSKYINITKNEPIYYSCHNNPYGNTELYYVTGKHP